MKSQHKNTMALILPWRITYSKEILLFSQSVFALFIDKE